LLIDQVKGISRIAGLPGKRQSGYFSGGQFIMRISKSRRIKLLLACTFLIHMLMLPIGINRVLALDSSVGVFRSSTGKWYLDRNADGQWSSCGTEGCHEFGTNGDLPVVGDWTGDGVSKIGVFRPNSGKWYLDLNGNGQWDGCGVDGCYMFGTSGDLPVAGDWDGDGVSEIGVFRQSTGKWFLDLDGNGQWDGCGVDGCYTFGTTGDMPIVGDWNGDGVDEIGVFRPSTGMWYLDRNGDNQWNGCGMDRCIYFGMNGDLPIAGDWDDDGQYEVGVFRPSTGRWYIDLNGDGQWDGCGVDGCYNFGMNGDIPVPGRWSVPQLPLVLDQLKVHTPDAPDGYTWCSYVSSRAASQSKQYILLNVEGASDQVNVAKNNAEGFGTHPVLSKYIIVTVAVPRGPQNYAVTFPRTDFSYDTEKTYRRPDLKINAMLDWLREELNRQGLNVQKRVLIYGFSNQAMFAQRYALLHPDRVKACAIGQSGGALTLPLTSYDGAPLTWPAGISDYESLTGKQFEFSTYSSIPKFIFIGENDTGPYQSTVYSTVYGYAVDIVFSLQQCQFMYALATTDPVRLQVETDIMKAWGDNVTFRMYPGIGHEFSEEWWNDWIAFIDAQGSN
jgi:pimeloyl-ACP methyl ester carboxylesterase